MAKSMRSKRKRKFRAIKRERYGKKELDRLKKTLGIEDNEEVKDIKMEVVAEIGNVKKAEDIIEFQMETDQKKKKYNPKTLKDEHGACPPWLHSRRLNKKRKGKKTNAGKKKKKGKKSFV